MAFQKGLVTSIRRGFVKGQRAARFQQKTARGGRIVSPTGRRIASQLKFVTAAAGFTGGGAFRPSRLRAPRVRGRLVTTSTGGRERVSGATLRGLANTKSRRPSGFILRSIRRMEEAVGRARRIGR